MTIGKIMRNVVFYVFLFLLLTGNVNAEPFEELMETLAKSKTKKAKFEEQKFAFYLDEPVTTKGELIYKYPNELIKIVSWPKKEKQYIKDKELKIVLPGDKVKKINIAQYPGLNIFAETLISVLAGNSSKLKALYQIDYRISNKQWSLSLIPVSGDVNKYYKSIELSGSANKIEQIKIIEINEDYSLTRLYEHKQD